MSESVSWGPEVSDSPRAGVTGGFKLPGLGARIGITSVVACRDGRQEGTQGDREKNKL